MLCAIRGQSPHFSRDKLGKKKLSYIWVNTVYTSARIYHIYPNAR
jgi:hypothetical protein